MSRARGRGAAFAGVLLALLVGVTLGAVARQYGRTSAPPHVMSSAQAPSAPVLRSARAAPAAPAAPATRAAQAAIRDSVPGGSATHGIHFAFAPSDTTPAD